MIKLHLGCGWRYFGEDWVHIDGGDYEHLDYFDITKLPYENDSVDLIYASCVIEYFDRNEVVDVLVEWNRVLRADGILRLSVPDFESISRLYSEGRYELDSFLGPLYGKMDMADQTIYHKTVYDYKSLCDVLGQTGYYGAERYDWRETEHSHFDDHSQAYLPHMDKDGGTLIQLNVEARKCCS